uniref:Uncharacterized protein n=1 Tax=Candidatus Methanogaster sp. ANME-2c ERB4 TaxID=2759911 RepID=A0A7G9YNV9_9EURY|nr:hypothetical protein CAMBNMFJ_00001 [Methanosarcinales archaeon ANME-2c ERB4]QNO49693.1 hypothetical protein ADAIOCCD_00001 [Methanosarcinales archaeon ANME-2c ERB4]
MYCCIDLWIGTWDHAPHPASGCDPVDYASQPCRDIFCNPWKEESEVDDATAPDFLLVDDCSRVSGQDRNGIGCAGIEYVCIFQFDTLHHHLIHPSVRFW